MIFPPGEKQAGKRERLRQEASKEAAGVTLPSPHHPPTRGEGHQPGVRAAVGKGQDVVMRVGVGEPSGMMPRWRHRWRN